jgi:uncharacterized protein YciI
MTNTLFIIILRYIADIETVEEYRAEHVEYLRRWYDKGKLLISGKQEPGYGGVIIARCENRLEVEAILEWDPFYTSSLAEYQIFEFTPARSIKELEFLWK